MEQLNDIIGFFLLSGTLVAIAYFSTSVEQLVRDVNNLTGFTHKSFLVLSYIPMLTSLGMVAEVNKTVLRQRRKFDIYAFVYCTDALFFE